jgi:hypothetical protein
MKKLLLFLTLTITFAVLLSGCQKSEQEKMDTSRKEQGIETISDDKALELIVGGKKAFIGILQGVEDDTELLDQFEMPYSPFKEEYDSPEKIKGKIEEYYYGEYAESLLGMIPAEYIDGRYALPIGDVGMVPVYDEFLVVDRSDLSEKSIKIKYKTDESSKESYSVYLEYVDGKWKITDEIREFDQK